MRRLSGVRGTIEFIRRVNGLADVQEVHFAVERAAWAQAGEFARL
jgi:hypothetical protein